MQTIWRIFILCLGLAVIGVFPCRITEFECANKQCITTNKFCNGIPDCTDTSDEFQNCSPCNTTYYGEVGYTYELEIRRPAERQMPFLCFLNFTAAGGSFGDLIQITFESFAVGTFESFTTDGCPDGFISIAEGHRVNSGGKWCGGAWGYSVYYSETSSVNMTLALNKFSQQESSGYSFEFKLSYKFLRLSDARIRYGNATRKSYRGKLAVGTYCDRLLEGCSKRTCRIQSPNYPGIYPRNVSCHFRVRERNVPVGKHALISVRQANFHYKENVPNFDNSDKAFKIWDQCNMMQDYIEILDGWGQGATTLAHLCSGETVPQIMSSGPELMIKFHTSPFGNPFHPLPLSYLPGFELEVEVFFVNKESPTYIEHGKRCEFLVTSFRNSTGYLENPLHSLPPNTTCNYHFRGQPKEVIWISFIKYHVTNERPDFNSGDCDVQLQIWDGDMKNENTVPLIGQFCKDDKPKLCDHTLLKNSSRQPRPCGLSESYISSSSDLTISQSIRYGSVLYPVSFVLRYEFIDLGQEGVQASRNPCDRLLRGQNGRVSSPRITFLYGRGGQKDLSCTYHFESTEHQKLKLTFSKIGFGNKDCHTLYNPDIDRWTCDVRSYNNGVANIKISEYPWKGVEIIRGCLCQNTSEPITITTKTAKKIKVTFTVTNMMIHEDYKSYFFEGNYEFVPTHNEKNCVDVWKTRKLRGSSGEITVRNSDYYLRISEDNQTASLCSQQPWLIEPEDPLNNFIYLKIRGVEKVDPRLCPSQNRILVYPGGNSEDIHIICPFYQDASEVVELFSEGWSLFSYRKNHNMNSRSFVVEFLQRERGNFVINWMEISKNPALSIPSSLLMISPPECPHSCPELGACISSDLWCDGLRHCPSGNDEQEANCALRGGFQISVFNSIALTTIALVIFVTISVMTFYMFKHWRREQKNVIVTVTEHTFLEFKSGLC
ncbi:uncharacterized protein LOC123316942 isoform X1 [Coccinella septempunctata]|uniref:uncharacterized protein LOC123316942 isoform X1 n=2 Tax=Coccinella septempunctata TaxID=41139 RepID=UPI001D068AA9|nr:uncharacterized protein LOC123316942 isoform X1 [Coccinella septempunctata]